MHVLFSFLLRHGNRTTPNCRTQLLDATKAGALLYIMKVLRMQMLMNLFTNSINDFNLSVLKFASWFCQGFSTWQWINSAKSITKTARKSSSLPPVMISTGSRNTWWTNRHECFWMISSLLLQNWLPGCPNLKIQGVFLIVPPHLQCLNENTC